MTYYQWLILEVIICCILFQDATGVVSVKRSTNEKLRDPGTYIICLEDSATDGRLQQFVKQLIKRSNRRKKFKAEIVSEYPSANCFTARLSKKALKWVRFLLPLTICIAH